MESILESQRRCHEERERLVEAMTRESMAEKRSHKAAINSQHRMHQYANRFADLTGELEIAYIDASKEREKEITAISGPNEFAEFYARLKSLKDYYKRAADEPASCLSLDFQAIFDDIANPEREEPDLVRFTDEEGYGRFLDMHGCYEKYLNLKGVKDVKLPDKKFDYISYLNSFDKFHEINRYVTKKSGSYKEYLQHIKDYLIDFIKRTRPLFDVEDEMNKTEADVNRLWPQGGVPGWKDQSNLQGALAPGPAAVHMDLSEVNSPEELHGVGLERLKSALQALGLKCGGTLEQRAERLFATKGKSMAELQKFTVPKKDGRDDDAARNKLLAVMEMQIKTIMNILREERDATKENVERKQARAGIEESDDEEDVVVEVDEVDYDDGIPYNPKNLPLDWDGKPIPYWLYKLHGLNISYACEICGNQKYKGPKAFQRHFSEWRHSHSMRCLGIPNTAHFMNITKIADALALWSKLKKDREQAKWDPDFDEEYEDSSGNVVNKRTYEDLKRQGLL